MTSVKLHKPTHEASQHGNQDNNFGQKITGMATRVLKTFTESRREDRNTAGTKQAQLSGTHQQQECHGSVCTWKPAAGNEMKKKEKKDKHAVIGAPKKAEKNPVKKKKSKDYPFDKSSSSNSESEDNDFDRRKK